MDIKEIIPWLGLVVSCVLIIITITNNHRTVKRNELTDLAHARMQEIASLHVRIDRIEGQLANCLRECEDYQRKNTDLMERLLRRDER